jgi:hypothetical protein
VAEWVLTGFGRECEQMGSQAWPCGFGGESGDVPIGLVELGQGLWSDELFGREVEGVGVTLDGVVQAGGGVVEFAQLGGGGGGGVVAGEDLLQGLGRGARRNRVRTDDTVGVTVADNLEVEVVGVPSPGEHRVQLLA